MTDQDRVDYFANRYRQVKRQLAWYKSRRTPKSTAAELAKYARYRKSEKGHARMERYNRGAAGQATAQRYRDTGVPYMRALHRRVGKYRAVVAQMTKEIEAARAAK